MITREQLAEHLKHQHGKQYGYASVQSLRKMHAWLHRNYGADHNHSPTLPRKESPKSV